jgi:hypothetical protein
VTWAGGQVNLVVAAGSPAAAAVPVVANPNTAASASATAAIFLVLIISVPPVEWERKTPAVKTSHDQAALPQPAKPASLASSAAWTRLVSPSFASRRLT